MGIRFALKEKRCGSLHQVFVQANPVYNSRSICSLSESGVTGPSMQDGGAILASRVNLGLAS